MSYLLYRAELAAAGGLAESLEVYIDGVKAETETETDKQLELEQKPIKLTDELYKRYEAWLDDLETSYSIDGSLRNSST